ncbi:MAG: hypothetical protein HZA50_13415 [Planctomycetes bacterium]|nr:hypothetical protein [Planctomycetota bacterium]
METEPKAKPVRKKRPVRTILMVVLVVMAFCKADNILWGYLGWPTTTCITLLVMLISGVILLVALIVRLATRKWMTGTFILLLVFLDCEPYFPSPGVPYILGYYLRVKHQVDIPAVRAWAANYQFKKQDSFAESTSSAPTSSVIRYKEREPLNNLPTGLNGLGFVTFYKDNRSVHVGYPGGFSSCHGLVIGADARLKGSQLDPFDSNHSWLTIGDDAYVWYIGGK